MNNLKILGIAFAIFVLILAGSIVYSLKLANDSYDNGFIAGQQSIKPTSSRIDTVHDTIRVPAKSKPISKPIAPKDTSKVNAIYETLKNDNDSLKKFIVNRLQPKQFLVSDPNNRAIAVINYDPIPDEYDGYVELTSINTDSNFVKEGLPCPEPVAKEEWYEDASMYAAGGVTGIVVVASGGTVLLGLGVTIGVSAVIAIF